MYWLRRNFTSAASPQSAVITPVPAAQYVRMSDETQQYSIENQKAAISEYASQHGFVIVKTYADHGKSGVVAKNRQALAELLKEVTSGDADFKAILVYDISRWGRFPNNDEAAYYEFLCAKAGIPLHYCAEPFRNDETAVSSLLKALKRSMAAEYSRELSEKVTRGKTRLVEMGFWTGGPPGYGYRRLMLSADGTPKEQMEPGQHKSFTMDRVVLVPGPDKEREGVQLIFTLAIQRVGCTDIARELNRRGFRKEGKPWTNTTIYNTVTNPKYAGWNVWHRTTQRMHSNRTPVEPQYWIKKTGAFEGIVDQKTFDLAQTRLPKITDYRWTDSDILKRIRKLLKTKGRITETLILNARNMPVPSTIKRHFGNYRQLYKAVGYHFEEHDIYRGEQCERSMELRRNLVAKIAKLFPEHIAVTHVPKGTRSILCVDDTFMVSVLLCRTKRRQKGGLHWVVEPSPMERDNITLFCKMNPTHDKALSYHLFPRMNFKSHRSYDHDLWLKTSVRLRSLADFYESALQLWGERIVLKAGEQG
jgi:DNA invertase Pin-like site-specific DNA recombinase